MENWLLLQTIYHGISTNTRETIKLLTLEGVQSSLEQERQPRKKERGMHQLKEVDMLSAKMELLMKRLEDKAPEKKEVMQLFESRMTCEECGNTGHSTSQCPQLEKDVNYINNNNQYHRIRIKDGLSRGPTTQVIIQVTIKVIILPIISHL
jgi:hypothetical protein